MKCIFKGTIITFMALMFCVITTSTANAQVGPVTRVVTKRVGPVAKPVFNQVKKGFDWGVRQGVTVIKKTADLTVRGPIIIGNDRTTTIRQQPRPRPGRRVYRDLRGH